VFEVFQGEGKDVKDIDVEALFESVKLSKDPFNFLDRVNDWEHLMSSKDLEMQKEVLEMNQIARKEQEGKMVEGKRNRKRDIDDKLKIIQDQENDNIEAKSQALRS